MTEIGLKLDPERLLAEEDFVRRLARGLLFDDHRVDDVVQDTWVAALRSKSRPQSLRAWLATIVRNQAANEARGARRRIAREREAARGEETLPSADEVLEREDQRREVVEALRGLTEPYRTAVTLRYLEGLEPAEIAQSQGVPAATVRSHVRRGLALMRERLDAQHAGDRRAWCLLLVPIARPQDAAAAGMATTLVGLGIAMKLTMLGVGATALAALVYLAWPADAAPTPIDRTAASSPGDPGTNRLAGDPGAGTTTAEAGRSLVDDADSGALGRHTDPARLGGYRGRLVDPSGAPLAKAKVRLFAFDPSALFLAPAFSQREAETDADGEFVFDSLPNGSDALLLADVEGPLRQLVSIEATVLAGERSDLGTFRLEDRGQVTGIVHDAAGNPVAGAEVLAAQVPAVALAAFPLHRFVLEQGALLTLPRPTATELASPEGLAEYPYRLMRALAVLGRDPVTDPDGPDHAAVVLDGEGVRPLWEQLPLARTNTDDAGRFVLRGVSDGNPLLVVRPPAGSHAGVARSDGLRVASGRTTDAGVIALPRGELCAGFVFDPETDEGVAGVEVKVAPIGLLGFTGAAPCEATVTTDSDGLFEVHGVDRIPHLVAFRRGPTEPWTLHGPIAPGEEPEIPLPPRGALTIRLMGAEGVEGSEFQIEARPTPLLGELGRLVARDPFHRVSLASAESGVLRTEAKTHGAWTFRITHPDFHPRIFVANLPSERPLTVNLLPRRPLTIAVRRPDGRPCVGATVLVQDVTDLDAESILPTDYGLPIWNEHLPEAPVRTDERGEVELDSVAAFSVVSAFAPDGSGMAVAKVGENPEQRRITLELGGVGKIEGRIEVGPVSMRKVGDFQVVLRQPTFGDDTVDVPPFRRVLLPDAEGRFGCESVPEGRYYVELFERSREPLTLERAIQKARSRSNIWFRESGIQEREIQVTAGRSQDVVFQIGGADPTLGYVTGVVRVDGEPAVGYPILRRDATYDDSDDTWMDWGWETSDRIETDAEGRFVFADLKPGKQVLGVADRDDGDVLHLWSVDILAGRGADVHGDIRTGSAELTLVDEQGRPVTDSNVLLKFAGAETPFTVALVESTDAQGCVRFTRIGAGRYEVRLMSSFADLEETEIDVPAGSMPFEGRFTVTRRYVINAHYADDLRLKDNQMVGLQARLPNVHTGPSSATTGDRVQLSLAHATTYDLYLFLDGDYYRADPPSITLSEPETTITVRRGPKVD